MLSRETMLRMLLQSRSLRLAIARYHLTTVQALRCKDGSDSSTKVLRAQMELLMKLDEADFDRFDSFKDSGTSKPIFPSRHP